MSFPNGSVGEFAEWGHQTKLGNHFRLRNHLAWRQQSSERIEWRYIYLHDKHGNYLETVKTESCFSSILGEIARSYWYKCPYRTCRFWSPIIKKLLLDSTSHSTVPVINEHGFQIGIVGHTQPQTRRYIEIRTTITWSQRYIWRWRVSYYTAIAT